MNTGLSLCYNYNDFYEITMTFSRSTEPNLSARLAQALTPEQGALLRLVADFASRSHLPLYIVGGFVRDLLLGHPGLDFDLVVEGDAIGLARAVAVRLGGKLKVHTRFKTAQWFSPPATDFPKLVDFISARSEVYRHPAALPTVRPGNITDDLRRRDFTINTLAIRLDGEHFGKLHDDLGGLEDLQAGFVRVLHPASFSDDPTRLFRAVRYEQRYGFQIAPETLSLFPETLPIIGVLSAARIRHELDLILDEENAAFMLKRLSELGLLAAVHPALEWKHTALTRFVNGMAAAQTLEQSLSRMELGWVFWLMEVPPPVLKSIEKRLHFKSGLRDTLLAASAFSQVMNSLAGNKPSRCVAILDEFPLKAIQVLSLAQPADPIRQELHNYLVTWRHVKPRTTGHDLKKRGLPPGPIYQSILTRLRAAWLDGEIKTVTEEEYLLEKLINK
jgi:tRNA nucleotidyltransferase (CCA-adding enzyme)